MNQRELKKIKELVIEFNQKVVKNTEIVENTNNFVAWLVSQFRKEWIMKSAKTSIQILDTPQNFLIWLKEKLEPEIETLKEKKEKEKDIPVIPD